MPFFGDGVLEAQPCETVCNFGSNVNRFFLLLCAERRTTDHAEDNGEVLISHLDAPRDRCYRSLKSQPIGIEKDIRRTVTSVASRSMIEPARV
jgi:hypothetical protein